MGSVTSKTEIASWSEQVVAKHVRGINIAFARYGDALEEIGGFNGEALLDTTESDLEPIFVDLGVKHLHKIRLRAEFKKLQQLTEIPPELLPAAVDNYLQPQDDDHRAINEPNRSISSSEPSTSVEISSSNSISSSNLGTSGILEPTRSTPKPAVPPSRSASTPTTAMPAEVVGPSDATLAVGSRCAALFASGSEWYPGVVSGRRRSRGMMTYSIEYDDGDIETSVAAGLVRSLPQDLSPDDAEAQAAELSSEAYTVSAMQPLGQTGGYECSCGRASPLQAVLAEDGREAWELSANGNNVGFAQAQVRRRALEMATAAESPSKDPPGLDSGSVASSIPPPKPLPREMLQSWNKKVSVLSPGQKDPDTKLNYQATGMPASSEAVPKPLPKEMLQNWNKSVPVLSSNRKDNDNQLKASFPQKAALSRKSPEPSPREIIQNWDKEASVAESSLEGNAVQGPSQTPVMSVTPEESPKPLTQEILQNENSALLADEEALRQQKNVDVVKSLTITPDSSQPTPLPSVAQEAPPPNRGDRRRSREAAPARAPPLPPPNEPLLRDDPTPLKAEEITLAGNNEETEALRLQVVTPVVAKGEEIATPFASLEEPTAPRMPRRLYPGPPPPVHPSSFKGLGREKFKALLSNACRHRNGIGSSAKAAAAAASTTAAAANFDVGAAVWVSDSVSAFVAGQVASVVPSSSDNAPGAIAASEVATVTLVGSAKVVDVQAKSKGKGGKNNGNRRGGVGVHLEVLPREALQGGGASNMDNLGAPHAAAVLENVDTR